MAAVALVVPVAATAAVVVPVARTARWVVLPVCGHSTSHFSKPSRYSSAHHTFNSPHTHSTSQLITKAITAGLLNMLGDVLAQVCIERSSVHDWHRTMVLTIVVCMLVVQHREQHCIC